MGLILRDASGRCPTTRAAVVAEAQVQAELRDGIAVLTPVPQH